MFKGVFSTRAFLKRTDKLSTNAYRSLRHFFDTLAFLQTRVSVLQNSRFRPSTVHFVTIIITYLIRKRLSRYRYLRL